MCCLCDVEEECVATHVVPEMNRISRLAGINTHTQTDRDTDGQTEEHTDTTDRWRKKEMTVKI